MGQQDGDGTSGILMLPRDDADGLHLALAIQHGDLGSLEALLDRRHALASCRIAGRRPGGWRTPLHITSDWPGYFPEAPAAVAILAAAGADPNDDTGGDQPETPLHWAASSDDVDVAIALIEAGARLDTPGGSIGTPLDNAVGYGCWHVARLLVDRGAPVDGLWQAAGLGMLSRIRELLDAEPRPSTDDVNAAFWQACSGGQRRAAELLLAAGADINATPDYSDKTALEVSVQPDTRRDLLASWLQERGAGSPAD